MMASPIGCSRGVNIPPKSVGVVDVSVFPGPTPPADVSDSVINALGYPTEIDGYTLTSGGDDRDLAGEPSAPNPRPIISLGAYKYYSIYSGGDRVADYGNLDGIFAWRMVGFDPSYAYCGAERSKVKIYGPAKGLLCVYNPADFVNDVSYGGGGGTIAKASDPTTDLGYYTPELRAALLAATPLSYSAIDCAEGSSFEFGVAGAGTLLTYPYTQIAIVQFWPGYTAARFPGALPP